MPLRPMLPAPRFRFDSDAFGACCVDDAVARIKQSINIVDLVGEYLPLQRYGAKFRGVCPFHDDHHPSMMVDPTHQNFKCWACGAGGDVFTFVQQYERLTFVEVKQKLADRVGITLSASSGGGSGRKQLIYRVLQWAAEQFQVSLFDSSQGSAARQYLEQRGLSDATVRGHGIGFAPPLFEWLVRRAKPADQPVELLQAAGLASLTQRGTMIDFFRGRLMFPIRDERKRIVGFGGRILPSLDDGKSGKYMNTPANEVYNKSEVLYGLDVAVDNGKPVDPIYVMEGYTDCLMAYQQGLKRCVAPCGTALTSQHITKLKRFADRIVLTFDGDAAGQRAADKVTKLFLSAEVDLRLCVLPDNQDPCDFILAKGIEAFRSIADLAPDAIDHLIKVEAKSTTGHLSAEEKRRRLENVLRTLAEIPVMSGSSYKVKFDLALNRLSQGFGIDEPTLRRWMAELRSGSPMRRSEPEASTPDLTKAPVPVREKQIAAWLLADPKITPDLRPLLAGNAISHPLVRRLIEACFAVYDAQPSTANTDLVRERLDDPALDAYVIQWVAETPTGEAYDQGLGDILAQLTREQELQWRHEAKHSLAPDAVAGDHLALLNRWRNQNVQPEQN